MNTELALPEPFARHYGPNIREWLRSAKPGDTMLIYTGRGPAGPFVSASYVERHTIELRARPLPAVFIKDQGLLVEPADAASRLLVERETGFLEEQAGIEAQRRRIAIEDMLAGTGIAA